MKISPSCIRGYSGTAAVLAGNWSKLSCSFLLLTLQIPGRKTQNCMLALDHALAALKTLSLPCKRRDGPGEG